MKKIILVLVFASLFLAGCGNSSKNKVTVCTSTEQEGTVTIYSTEDIVTKVETSATSTLEEMSLTDAEYDEYVAYIEQLYSSIEGVDVKFTRDGNKVTMTLTTDYTAAEENEKYTLAEVLDGSEDSGFTCKTK